jgi:hypothetical protein
MSVRQHFKTVAISAPEVDLAAWREAAWLARQSLSAWVRSQLALAAPRRGVILAEDGEPGSIGAEEGSGVSERGG